MDNFGLLFGLFLLFPGTCQILIQKTVNIVQNWRHLPNHIVRVRNPQKQGKLVVIRDSDSNFLTDTNLLLH